MKSFLILPAYNEAASIESLLARVELLWARAWEGEVIVVDDGSSDDTVELVTNWMEGKDAELLRHDPNQGLGAAIQTGILRALEKANDQDVLITMDADDSHSPALIERMLQHIREGSDLVIASRYQAGARIVGLSRFRKLLSWAAGWMMRILVRVPYVRDYTCGFRAYRVSLLRQVVGKYGSKAFIEETGFACMIELLLKCARFHPVIHEVPLILRYDQKKSPSKMRILRTIRQTLKLISRTR